MDELSPLRRKIVWGCSRNLFANFYLRYKYRFSLSPSSDPWPSAPPYLIVANHGTFFDPWIVGGYSRFPVGLMTNDDAFREGKITPWYLKNVGAFPKKKGASDYRAIKKTLELLQNGIPVCIFPEGQTTWDGETQLLYPGLEKLLKRAGCPLVAVRLQGNFLTKPWWATSMRSGRILVTVKIYSPEEIANLSNEELFNTIKASIYQNDIKDPENLAVPFSGKNLAHGLERLVWICLGCGAEDTLVTNGDYVTCSECGHTVKLDAHCRITVTKGESSCGCTDLKDWVDLHKQRVKEKIAAGGETLTRSDGVTLQLENSVNEFTDSDFGTLVLTPSGMDFRGNGSPLHWNITDIHDWVIQKKDIFEFRHDKQHFRFLFTKKSPMKWICYIRYLAGFEACEKQGHL